MNLTRRRDCPEAPRGHLHTTKYGGPPPNQGASDAVLPANTRTCCKPSRSAGRTRPRFVMPSPISQHPRPPHSHSTTQATMKRGGGKTPPPNDASGTGSSPYVSTGPKPFPPIPPPPPPPPQSASAPGPPLGTERDRPLDLSAYLEPGLRDGMLEEKKRRNKRREPWFYMPTVPAFKWLREYQPKKDLFGTYRYVHRQLLAAREGWKVEGSVGGTRKRKKKHKFASPGQQAESSLVSLLFLLPTPVTNHHRRASSSASSSSRKAWLTVSWPT